VVGAPVKASYVGAAYVYEPASTLARLSALSPAKVWIGLKNSDDVSLRLDLLAEVFINVTKTGQGKLDNVGRGGSGFNNAVLNTRGKLLNWQKSGFLIFLESSRASGLSPAPVAFVVVPRGVYPLRFQQRLQ
jgi:hypothetical protein